MVLIEIDDEVNGVIEAATVGGESPTWTLRRLLGLPHPEGSPTSPIAVGELAELIAAGLIGPGDPLYATAPVRDPRPVAAVADGGRLRAADGIIYLGPRQLVAAVRGATFESYGWQCLSTADGTRLEALRQRLLAKTAPHLLPTGPGGLAPLIAAGYLAPGDVLSLPMYRSPGGRATSPVAIGYAKVTGDGCFLLPQDDLYLTPTAATAAYRGNPFNAWGSWTAPDTRRLVALRALAAEHR